MNRNKAYAQTMTPHAEKLLGVIRSATHPLTRADIAAALGKRSLTPWDVAVLEMLDERGLIQIDSRTILVEFSYQAVKE